MRTFALALALLMPVAIDGTSLAEVVPKVLTSEIEIALGPKDLPRLFDDLKRLKGEEENYQKAIDILEKILLIVEKELGTDHPKISELLNPLAMVYIRQGSIEKAEQLLVRNLAIQKNFSRTGYQSEILKETASICNLLASTYRDQGLYSKAEPFAQKALSIRKKLLGHNHPSTATALNNLALIYDYQGLYSKSIPLYKKALVIYEKERGARHKDTAATINNLALAYVDQGSFDIAEPLLIRALAITEERVGLEHPSTAATINNLASLYEKQGLFAKAKILYERSLAIEEKAFGSDHPNIAISLNNLAGLYVQEGLNSKAEPLYQRALSIEKKAFGSDHPNIAISLNNLADLYRRQGLFQKAIPLYKRSLAIDEKAFGSDHPNIAVSLNNLALTFSSQGFFSKAEPIFQRALVIKEKAFGLEHPSMAKTLNNLALAYEHQGFLSKSEPLYQRALSINEKAFGSDHPETSIALNNLGSNYLLRGLYNKSEPLFLSALAINETLYGDDHLDTIGVLYNLAFLYDQKGLFSKSESLYQRAIKSSMKLIQRESPYLALSDRQLYSASIDRAHLGFYMARPREEATKLALLYRLNRQGLLEEIEKRQAQLATLDGPQKAIAEELRTVTQNLASRNISNKRRQEMSRKQEVLEKQLYRLLPELTTRFVEISDIANKLPKDAVLIEYQRYLFANFPQIDITEMRYQGLLLKPNGEIASVDLGPAAPIEKKIQQALIASEEGLADAQQLWKEVGDLVIKPLKESIGDAQTLFISPDAELNRIPFAALSSHTDNQLLGDVVKIRLLTTGRELIDLAKESKPTKQKPLVVANPTFDLRNPLLSQKKADLSSPSQKRSVDLSSISWPSLPGTAKEGKVITKLINANLLMEHQATAITVQKQAAPKVLHIASHSYFLTNQKKEKESKKIFEQLKGFSTFFSKGFQGENPLVRSGIVLAGANHPEANPEDDGYLTALEVAKVDWQGTEMVVISGCESGKGDIQSGEGVYGLKRSIAVAGARSSVLSLWKVNDIATAAFMKSFYERLKRGEGRAEALAATQKEFRNHPKPAWRHPYVWAAFQLSGDWRPIDW